MTEAFHHENTNMANLIVWGTGKRSKEITELLSYYRESLTPNVQHLIPEIDYYIDSNLSGDREFMGKGVRSVMSVPWNERASDVMVAIAQSDEVVAEARAKIGDNAASKIKIYTQVLTNIRTALIDAYASEPSVFINDKLKKKIKVAWLIKELAEKRMQKDIISSNISPSELLEGLFHFYEGDYFRIGEFLSKNGFFPKKRPVINNIGIVCTTLGSGGAQRVVSNLMPIYLEQGYEVTLITEQIVSEEYTLSSGIARENISPTYTWNTYLDYLKDYETILKQRKIDLLCFHIPYVGFIYFLRVLLAKMMGIRVITHVHTGYLPFMQTEGLKMDYTYVYSFSDRIIALSENDSRCWKEQRINAICIKNPIDKRLQPCYRTKENYKKKNKILWLGSIYYESKQVSECIYIMSELKKIRGDITLDIVGTYYDEDYHKLNDLITAHGLEGYVSIYGFDPNPEKYYKNADIFLMTSAIEGAPMVILEAKCYGLPVVMYDIPYLDFVKEPKGMVIVDQLDRKRTAAEINHLFEDEEMYFKMSHQASGSFETYASENTPDKWKTLFTEMSLEDKNNG